MVYWLEIIYFIFWLHGLSRCLYFWQLKEYRLDRFFEWHKTGWRRYWLPSAHFFRPRLTLKILVLAYLAAYFSIFIIQSFSSRLMALIMVYLILPPVAALAVALISPISDLLKAVIVLAAKLKLRLWHPKLLVVGVTGSYGKTSTKEILAHILKLKFRVAKTPETNNTLIGAAKTVLFNLPGKTAVLVAEMGAYKIGEIREICCLVRPKIGILTGINEQHLALFGSLANTVKAKAELLQALPKNGLAVVNGTNRLARQAAKLAKAPVRFYKAGRFKTNLLGAHQQLNLSAAVTAARYLGVDHFDFEHIPGFKTAITKTRGLNGATIINDSYNSNPDGFMAAVALAKTFPARRKTLITPGIIELGPAGPAIQQRLETAAKAVFDRVVFTKKDKVAEPELLKELRSRLTKNDLLLIEGRFSPAFIRQLCLNQF